MKQSLRVSGKSKLSATLKNWLPLLQAGIGELEQKLCEQAATNPFCRVVSGLERSLDDGKDGDDEPPHEDWDFLRHETRAKGEFFADSLTCEESLYEHLLQQIDERLFPTPRSLKIALAIVEHIDECGFFDGALEEVASSCDAGIHDVERIRLRFAQITPCGVGAMDMLESFLFQIEESQCDDATYEIAKKIVLQPHTMPQIARHPAFKSASLLVKKLKNPPAVDFLERSAQVTPDIFVLSDGNSLEVKLNDAFYPEIIIENIENLEKDEFVRPKIKEAKDLVDALLMRKATLNKIGLMIVEYQYDFFLGGAIRPMKLKNLADELGLNISTISRAISSKYLACNRGVLPLKSFFSTAIGEETSAAAIREFIKKSLDTEDRKKPMSDEAILALVEGNFGVKMERRTITKYRKAMNLPSSGERKRLYASSL